MVKHVVYDCDGMVVRRAARFSERYEKEFGVSWEEMRPFFEGPFRACLIGQADLKQELANYLSAWKWQGTVDELVEYWLSHEKDVDERMLESVAMLRAKGVKCYLATANEKYRTAYLFDTLGLAKHFDGAFSSELGAEKSETEFWLRLHAAIGAPEKNEVLVLDDDGENVEAAREYGFDARLYTDFEKYEKETLSTL